MTFPYPSTVMTTAVNVQVIDPFNRPKRNGESFVVDPFPHVLYCRYVGDRHPTVGPCKRHLLLHIKGTRIGGVGLPVRKKRRSDTGYHREITEPPT